MLHRILLCLVLFSFVSLAYPAEIFYDDTSGENWTWGYGVEEGGSGSAYLGVDIADVTSERLSALKLKEEHGAEITMVDQDAPAGKAGLKEHDVILTLNGTAVESAAQLRRMIRETPPGRVITLGISRDGQPLNIKVQLANRTKSSNMFGDHEFKFEMPNMPVIPDFDIPVSVVIAHSSMRSGLMVENITPQLGDFFGVKNGNGVLVRSVEKGSRSDKAGFRAGDVIVKVNNQSVHDTSDFTRALRSSSGNSAAVTVMRDKKEQNLTLTLPEKKDSGHLLEDSFKLEELSAALATQVSQLGDQTMLIQPALDKLKDQTQCWKDLEQKLKDSEKKLKDSEQKMQKKGEKLRHELSGEWTEI